MLFSVVYNITKFEIVAFLYGTPSEKLWGFVDCFMCIPAFGTGKYIKLFERKILRRRFHSLYLYFPIGTFGFHSPDCRYLLGKNAQHRGRMHFRRVATSLSSTNPEMFCLRAACAFTLRTVGRKSVLYTYIQIKKLQRQSLRFTTSLLFSSNLSPAVLDEVVTRRQYVNHKVVRSVQMFFP